MAKRHSPYVNVYAGGARGAVVQVARQHDRWVQDDKAKSGEYVPCPGCGRMYKNPEHDHYSDFKNRIRCRFSEEAHGVVFPS